MKTANKIRIYKIIALLAAVFIAWQLSVFSITPDVTERAVVTMMGLDATDDGVRMSVRVLVPVSGGTEFTEISAESDGKNLQEATQHFLVLKGRKIEFGQCGILVFGDKILERGILEEARLLYASGMLSPGVVTVAASKSAEEFIKTAAGFGAETSEDIAKFLVRFQESTAMPALSLGTYLDGELSESAAAFIPVVKLSEQEDETGGDSMAVINSVGTVAVLKDGKRVGELTDAETRGLTLTLSGSKKGNYRTEGFVFNDQEYASVKGAMRHKSVRIKTDFVEGKPRIRYCVNAKIEAEPNPETAANPDKVALYATVSSAFEQAIQSDIESAFTASKNLGADFFLTKARFYRKNSKQIKQFDAVPEHDFLRDLIVEVDVKVKTF